MKFIDRQGASCHIPGLLYDGVLSAEDWQSALDAMRQALGASVFHFFTLGSTGGGVVESVHNHDLAGIDADKLREYETHYVGEDLRMSVVASLPQGQFMLDHEHFSAWEMSRNAVYVDVLAPHGLRNTLGVKVRDEGGTQDFLGFMRPTDRGIYGAQERVFMQQWMPDLARAARLRMHMGGLARQAALGFTALDNLPQGIALVDSNCRIHYCNPSADCLLAAFCEALSVRHGLLRCVDGQAQAQLLHLVAQACGHHAQGLAGALCLTAGSALRLMVTVLPLKPSHAAAFRQRPMALLVMADAGTPFSGPSPGLVQEALGLSPSEARLAVLLATGRTVKDYARIEGCSWHTARTHVKNLMRKTGCHRQVELVGLLQSLQPR